MQIPYFQIRLHSEVPDEHEFGRDNEMDQGKECLTHKFSQIKKSNVADTPEVPVCPLEITTPCPSDINTVLACGNNFYSCLYIFTTHTSSTKQYSVLPV